MAPIQSVASRDSCEVAPDLIMDCVVTHRERINLVCLQLSLPERMAHMAMPVDRGLPVLSVRHRDPLLCRRIRLRRTGHQAFMSAQIVCEAG